MTSSTVKVDPAAEAIAKAARQSAIEYCAEQARANAGKFISDRAMEAFITELDVLGRPKCLRDIVGNYLIRHGHDGLCNPDIECGCGMLDLMPCGEPHTDCVPARKTTKDGEPWYEEVTK